MNEYQLPKVPEDVLAAWESLPRSVLQEIELQLMVFSGCLMVQKFPTDLSKDELYEHMLVTHAEQMRLLRLAIKTHEGE